MSHGNCKDGSFLIVGRRECKRYTLRSFSLLSRIFPVCISIDKKRHLELGLLGSGSWYPRIRSRQHSHLLKLKREHDKSFRRSVSKQRTKIG